MGVLPCIVTVAQFHRPCLGSEAELLADVMPQVSLGGVLKVLGGGTQQKSKTVV